MPTQANKTSQLAAAETRGHLLESPSPAPAALLDEWTLEHRDLYQRNIENMIGTAKVPVGVAGPLRVEGSFADGDYRIPLATTEATLVASYHRGCKLITAAGGCRTLLIAEGVRRAPGFAFRDLLQVSEFVGWVRANFPRLQVAAASTSRFGQLVDLHIDIEGNHVYLGFEYLAGDAAGQNIVTIATQVTCDYILEHAPVKPQYHFVEANLSGDKKASAVSFRSVRGKKVSAEIVVPAQLVEAHLHASAAHMVDYWRMSAIGGVLSGSIGIQGHYANGLAALYIACGQDVACVAESAVGVTRFELTAEGDLYAAVTLPNLTVGTVGGGTGLPSQHACLELMNLAGEGNARAFAEVTAGLMLAGELSIIGALSAGQFTSAHQRFTRRA
jgi:hydroxymethylglutaryl-CoA reductase (NADPH)